MSVGKRLRFEVLKRDGFRCRYCGITAIATALEVDHVIAVANGGTDAAENLVAACIDCNRGKSDRPLDASGLDETDPLERARDHAEQIRAYLDAQREVENARAETVEWLRDLWCSEVGPREPHGLDGAIRSALARDRMEHIIESIRATAEAVNGRRIASTQDRLKYFYGCLKRRREGT